MARDSKPIDLSFVFNDYMAKVVGRDCVNRGFCYVWAWIVRAYHPDAVLCSDRGMMHAFVRLNGLYYDSNRPIQGIADWRKLRTYAGISGPIMEKVYPKTPRAFYNYWNLGDEFDSKLGEVYRRSKSVAFQRRIRRFTREHLEEVNW